MGPRFLTSAFAAGPALTILFFIRKHSSIRFQAILCGGSP
ncbi:MAG: hypothetical protein KDD15_16040 [Lewinella sp.]|nr:hypothetical protein [Lewinella sp.]